MVGSYPGAEFQLEVVPRLEELDPQITQIMQITQIKQVKQVR